MTTWFSSDLHFGHRNISRYCGRPFPDTDAGVAEMDDALVARWNETVAPGDTVWVLGDVAMGLIDRSLANVERLVGELRLVAGNHDRCWSGAGTNEARARWRQRYHDVGFVTITEEERVRVGDTEVLLSHFPYEGDSHDDDRHPIHRPSDDGGWLLHGHVHSTWRQSGRQINVGVDAWGGAPVAEDTLAELIAAGPAERAPLPWPSLATAL